MDEGVWCKRQDALFRLFDQNMGVYNLVLVAKSHGIVAYARSNGRNDTRLQKCHQ